jgi:Putative Ig domain
MLPLMPRPRNAPHILFLVPAVALLLGGCSGGGSGGKAPPSGSEIKIATTALPNGQVGHPYTANLVASGGTAPLVWAVTAGALPAGLALGGSTGVISGTPTAQTAGTALTFTVSDSAATQQSKSVALKLSVSPANIAVTISPGQAGLTVTQTLRLSASTNDYGGVSWSVSPTGGSFAPASSASGAPVTFTAPASAGVYTVTATSSTDTTQSAVITVGVTDLAGVYTYHNDTTRAGANTREYALTKANVNTVNFGKLFSCPVDGAVYAQPLWVANLSVAGARHNVVFVATEHDSLYAFDADASPCVLLWQVSLIDTGHGAAVGETSVPSGVSGYLVGQGGGDITPEVGVTGTPVIDPVSQTLYVVSKSVNAAKTAIYQRLHAIDITTGREKFAGSPVLITGSYPTSGGGAPVAFSAQQENQRAGLALVSGTVLIAWGSHEDASPWYGWVMGYTNSGSALTQASVLNVTPNSAEGGIWMAGGAPAADNNGNLYLITGNGTFDVTNGSAPNNDYGDSFLQLSGALGVSSWFTPSDQANDAANDLDFGSGGSAIVLNLGAGSAPQHLVIGGGKDGTLYLLNGDSMGGLGDGNAFQSFSLGVPGVTCPPGGPQPCNSIFATPAFWNNTVYIAPVAAPLLAYTFDGSQLKFTPVSGPVPASYSSTTYAFPGATPSVSAAPSVSNGIVWALDSSTFCGFGGCGPAVLHAYDATNLRTELWNSSMVAADAAGNAVKFTVPTIANGKVYVGTRGNNIGGLYGSTSVSGELDVYGLKPD